MSPRAIRFVVFPVAAWMWAWAVWALIYEPGYVASDVFVVAVSVALLIVGERAGRTVRRRTPAPRSVSEGCGSNRREVGDGI